MDQQLKDVLRRNATISDVAIAIEKNLDVLPSNILMTEEEIPISGLPGCELLLRKAITDQNKKINPL